MAPPLVAARQQSERAAPACSRQFDFVSAAVAARARIVAAERHSLWALPPWWGALPVGAATRRRAAAVGARRSCMQPAVRLRERRGCRARSHRRRGAPLVVGAPAFAAAGPNRRRPVPARSRIARLRCVASAEPLADSSRLSSLPPRLSLSRESVGGQHRRGGASAAVPPPAAAAVGAEASALASSPSARMCRPLQLASRSCSVARRRLRRRRRCERALIKPPQRRRGWPYATQHAHKQATRPRSKTGALGRRREDAARA